MTQSTYFNQVKNVLKVLQGYTKGIRFLLVMLLTLSVSANVWGEDFELVSFSDIKTNDVIIIVGTKSGTAYAMKNTGTPPTPIKVTISNSKITSTATDITFTATNNGDNTITFVSTASGTLYCTNDNNGVKIGSQTGDNTKFSFDSDVKRLKNIGRTRWLGIYNTQDWRCYTSASATNISGTTTTFYRKVTAAPSHTITATSNNNSYGTISVSGTTITATPNDGYRVKSGDAGYTMTSGTAVVTNNGNNTFSVTPSSNCTITINFEAIPQYTVTWDVNGDQSVTTQVTEGSKPTFPATPSSCDATSNTFYGWATATWDGKIDNISEKTIYTSANNMPAVNGAVTYYAVFATKGAGGGTAFDGTSGGDFKIYALVEGEKKYLKGTGSKISPVDEAEATEYTFTKISDGVFSIKTGTTYLTYASSTNLGTSNSSYSWNISEGTKGSWRIASADNSSRGIVYRAGTTNQFGGYALSNISANGTEYYDVEIGGGASVSYSGYITTCATAPVVPIATVDPTSVTTIAAGAGGKVTVTYENVNTANVAVALFNDAACTETFTAGWLTAALDGDKNITYTVAENPTYAERKVYIQLTAPETTGATEPAVVVIPVTQAGKDKVFASLEALLAAITPTSEGVEVTVTLTNEVIQDFYTSGLYRNGIALNVPYQAGVKVIEIYCKDVPVEWVKGGKVSGTITCPWKLYNSTWELCPTAWTELTYTAPATVKSIAVSGTPTKTTYVDGEAFDPTGLVVTATLTDDSTEPIDVALVDWTFNPETLSKGETSVSVVATYNTMASAAYEVTGLTVNDIPTKTVAEFIAAEGGRCYLEGIISNITNTTYGNFDLTDASGTIYIYGCLNEAGESQQFAALGVKNGDKIKVIADEYELYGGTKDEAKNVQYVSHISTATISIADITIKVGETKNIEATITPDAAQSTVQYAITTGSEYITLNGTTITAVAAGTATITATIAEVEGEYYGATVTFTVTVPTTYDVTWMVNGAESTTKEVVEEGKQITTLPEDPTDECGGKTFVGWSDQEVTDGNKPAVLFTDAANSPIITDKTTFYAVFATASGEEIVTSSLPRNIVYWEKQEITANEGISATTGSGTMTSNVTLSTKSNRTYQSTIDKYAQIILSDLNLEDYTNINLSFWARGSQEGSITIKTNLSDDAITTFNITGTETLYVVNNIPASATSIILSYGANSGSLFFGTVKIYENTTITYPFTKLTEDNTNGWTGDDWDGYYLITNAQNPLRALDGNSIGEKFHQEVTDEDGTIETSLSMAFLISSTQNGFTIKGVGDNLYLAPGNNSISVSSEAEYYTIGHNKIEAQSSILSWNISGSKFGFYGAIITSAPQLYKIMRFYSDYTTSCLDVNWTITEGGSLSTTSGITTTVIPNEGYTYGEPAYTITDGSATVTQNGNIFTAVPTTDCTIQINMVQKTTYTVTWMVNGKEYTEGTPSTTVYADERVATLPTPPEPNAYCGDVFVGWTTENPASGNFNEAPTVYNEQATFPTATGDQTFYAVFADYEQQ